MKNFSFLLVFCGTMICVGAGCTSVPPIGTTSVAVGHTYKPVDCTFFGRKPDPQKVRPELRSVVDLDIQYVPESRGDLPVDFADLADQSILCGASRLLHTSYYITKLLDNDLFAIFKKRLAARGCTTSDINVAGYNPLMNFTCQDGKGSIGRNAFGWAAYNIRFEKNK